MCRGRRRTMPFKMTLFCIFLREGNKCGSNPKIGYDSYPFFTMLME